MSDFQNYINVSFSVLMAVIGWFAREMWAAVKELKADLAKLKEQLPKEYLSKNDYKEDIRELKDMLNKIFDRLDNKADKQ